MRALPVALFLLLALGPHPAGAAPFAYVPNYGSNNVSVIDTATNTVVATVPVGTQPVGVAVTPDGARVYVTNNTVSGTVSVIDTATHTVVATVPVGNSPFGVAVTPDGARVYVTSNGGGVSVIDTATHTVVATVPVGGPGVAVTPDGARVYVTNFGPETVSVIDTATNAVVATVPVGDGPFGVAVTPDGARVYVAFTTLNVLAPVAVSVIDTATNTVVATVSVATEGRGVAVTPDGGRVYMGNNSSTVFPVFPVFVIDTATNAVVATVPLGTRPFGVAVTPDGAQVYVANVNSNNVSVVDTATNAVVATVPVGAFPVGFGIFIAQTYLAVPTHFTVTAPGAATAGTAFDVTVTAVNEYGHVATGYKGTVQITSSDPQAGLPPAATLTNGVGTFSVTLGTVGTRTLTAKDSTTPAITGTSSGIAVGPGAATHFSVTAPASATAGTAFDFTVTALDQFNNTATGYSGTVQITSSDPLAVLPAAATLTNGVGTFSAKLGTVGIRTLTATDSTTPAITGTSSGIAVSALTSFSAPSPTGPGTIVASLVSAGGGPGCTLASPQFIGPPPGAPPIPPTLPFPWAVFPHGLFDFSTTGCTPGATITVTLTYPQPLTGLVYWKYGPTPGVPTPHWYVLPATIAGNVVTFSITDGGLGDDDLTANGTIVDQGGPGSPMPAPTLSQWAFLALALVLLAAGARRLAHARLRSLG